ncbi:MAG: ATP phosphoribosyltransferase regulatory subunit [Clostridia bacterium]|nr:ATP phosphoribosyltransferase regulatory subunit [Clostridia bacterium]
MCQAKFDMKRDEEVVWNIRDMFEKRGYRKYRMGKFEAYDLYLENKGFLKDRQIITFNDVDGRVLALKPDVTLSIVKNTRATETSSEKLYYIESVYRFDKPSACYREISQLGLEYLGPCDDCATGEVVVLAAKTLGCISPNYFMQIGNVGYVASLMDALSIGQAARREITGLLRAKNAHELKARALALGMAPAAADMILGLLELCGPYEATLEKARTMAIMPGMSRAVDNLYGISLALKAAKCIDRCTLDFSLTGDMEYYNGVTLQGFVEGLPRSVLTGGGYPNLLKKFGRDIDAIGFAVNLNELETLYDYRSDPDADVLLLYEAGESPERVALAAEKLNSMGLKVRCEINAPADMRFGRKTTVKEALEDA